MILKKLFKRPPAQVFLPVATALFLNTAHAQQPVPDWPDLYDPFTLLTLNLEVDPAELNTILSDTTYDIEVPAWFWAENEEPILISVRRKSAEELSNGLTSVKKVSFKLDINEFKDMQGGADEWHGVKKLSLENGDDQDVVQEGFAWYLHRRASESSLDYQAGLASWVKLNINGVYYGVYVNVEQPDKQYLKNRVLWGSGDDTWLYKMSDINSPEAKESPVDSSGSEIESPASQALCYDPFKGRDKCPTPGDFKAQLNDRINMEGMLTLGAVSAFHYSPDDLFTKGKNFYYTDFLNGSKREYMQWDLDSAFGSLDPNSDIYIQGKGRANVYEKALVAAENSPFRGKYSDIIRTLLNDGAFDEATLLSDLQTMEDLLGPALAADANSKEAAASFGSLSAYIPLRIASMRSQLDGGGGGDPPPTGGDPVVYVGDLDGSSVSTGGNSWDATVTITLRDDEGNTNFGGAMISGSWSRGVSSESETSGVINSAGQLSLTANVTQKKLRKVTFTVSSVSYPGSVYNPQLNQDDEPDSDGTSITISKP